MDTPALLPPIDLLCRLVAPLDPETFVREHWARRPMLSRGALGRFDDLLGLDEAYALARELPPRLGRPGQTQILALRRHDRWIDGGRRGPAPLEQILPMQVPLLLQCDATVQFLDLDASIPRLRAATMRLKEQLAYAGPINASCWISPPGEGVEPHIDHLSTFVIQLGGRKVWTLGDQLALPFPRRTGSLRPDGSCAYLYPQTAEPWEQQVDPTPVDSLRRIELTPGDVLFIPAGVYHGTSARDSTSVALHLSLHPVDARDVLLEPIARRLGAQASWRSCPPCCDRTGTMPVEIADFLRDRIDELVDELRSLALDDERLAKAWHAAVTRVEEEDEHGPRVARESIAPSQRLALPRGVAVRHHRSPDGGLTLLCGGREARFDDPQLVRLVEGLLTRADGFIAAEAIQWTPADGRDSPDRWVRVATVLQYLLDEHLLEALPPTR